jgi:hypothetical protein
MQSTIEVLILHLTRNSIKLESDMKSRSRNRHQVPSHRSGIVSLFISVPCKLIFTTIVCNGPAVQSYDCSITFVGCDTPDMLPGKLQGYVKDVDKDKLVGSTA